MFNLYSGRAPPTQACFQIYRRLSRSLHVHKTFFTNWLARYDLVIIIFTGGYRALYTCTKRVYKVWLGRGRNVIIFDSRAATALSTHAQNACKQKYFVRKMRRRRENFEIQELKRSFLVLKTRKIYQNRVKHSGKIAPKARNFLGYFGDFWRKHVFGSENPPPCSTPFSNKGGGFASENMLRKNPAEGRKFLWFWCLKSLGERYGNVLKAWFLQGKSCFLSV